MVTAPESIPSKYLHLWSVAFLIKNDLRKLFYRLCIIYPLVLVCVYIATPAYMYVHHLLEQLKGEFARLVKVSGFINLLF